MYHKALFEKVAAAIDFSKMAPDQNAAFRQGTATNFNSKSWLDRNKMYRKMQGEADWSDNAKARAMGSNFQAPSGPVAAVPTATPPAPSTAPISLRPLSNQPEYVTKGRPFGGNSQPPSPVRNLPPMNRASGGNSFWNSFSGTPAQQPPSSAAAAESMRTNRNMVAPRGALNAGRSFAPAPSTPPVDPQFQAFFNRAMGSR